MNLRSLSAGILTAAIILSLSTVSTFAADTEAIMPISVHNTNTAVPVNIEATEKSEPYFNFFNGTVTKIDSKFIHVQSPNGSEANFIVSKDTYIVNDAKIVEGSVITGYYDANAPMIMIYPPQYNVEVIVVEGSTDLNVKVDVFNKDLISSDNFLKLNISDETELVWEDGTAFKGSLENRNLVVLYGISTKSIPAQTTPEKVVVLFDKAKNPAMDIVVNEKKIEAPKTFINEQGTLMVPLRAITEALGYEVSWNGELRQVGIGKGISLTIDKDYYVYMKTAPISLGTAPVIVNDRTFVPLNFFTRVLHVNDAKILDSQIVIEK
jgi:hypothetical protein